MHFLSVCSSSVDFQFVDSRGSQSFVPFLVKKLKVGLGFLNRKLFNQYDLYGGESFLPCVYGYGCTVHIGVNIAILYGQQSVMATE